MPSPDRPPRSVPNLQDIMSASSSRLADGQIRRASLYVQEQRRVERLSRESGDIPDGALVAWMCLGKRPIRDQMSLEMGTRVGALSRLVTTSSERPDLICFCGGDLDAAGGSSYLLPSVEEPPPMVSASRLAYSFFRTAMEEQGRDAELSHTRYIVEPRATVRDGVLTVASALRDMQMRRAAAAAGAPAGGAYGAVGVPPYEGTSPPTFVRLVATDHLLMRLSDMEALTPRDSPLRPLHDLGAEIAYEHVREPWSYSPDATVKRQARHVRLAESIGVVLANLRGVAVATDFLHPDNARTLADVRVRLSDELWKLMPGGASAGGASAGGGAYAGGAYAGGAYAATSGGYGGYEGDAGGLERGGCELECLEAAVASLGRATELLSPLLAEPLTGRVSDATLEGAREALLGAVGALKRTDPDRPLTTREWIALARGRELTCCPLARRGQVDGQGHAVDADTAGELDTAL